MEIKINPKDYWIDDDGYLAYGTGDDYITVTDEILNDHTGNHVEMLTTIIESWPDLLAALKLVLAVAELEIPRYNEACSYQMAVEAITKTDYGVCHLGCFLEHCLQYPDGRGFYF